jgi:AcrR family transcriptional regulator
MQRLLKFGREELEQAGAVGFNVDRVLRRAKVSTSSLYHHFGNRDGFIVAVEFERSYNDLVREIEMLRTYVVSTDDPDALIKASEFVLTLGGEPRGKERRRHRVETLAAATRNPALRRMLSDAQREGTAKYMDVLRLAMEKRGGEPHYPIEGIAYLVQSILLGRVLVDLTDDDELGKAWETTALGAIRAVLSPS